MGEELHIHQFGNGLTLVGEQMAQVSSAAMTIALPAGASRDPEGMAGAAAVASCWLFRGAGRRDTRQLHDALDSLGCQHHEEANSAHLLLSAAQLSRNLPEVIAIYADVLRRPRLTDEAFGPCRDLVQQALDGLEDQPMQKCNVLLRENFYPYPLGRNPLGTKDTLSALDSHRLRTHVQAHLTPANTLLAVAGQFDWGQLVETVGTHLGDWQGGQPAQVATRAPLGGVGHIEKPSAQVQITLAYPAATVNHATYYWCRLAQTVLSGGMSSRLFTEVREKRGLVYAIAAQYHSLKEHAGIFVYAGTTPEHVQETLEVTVEVLRGLSDGIDEEELARARVQLRSALVMQGESTSARADALAGDYYHLGRLRHLEEISAAIEGVRRDQVAQYARMFPAERFTALTIGPKQPDTALLG